MRYILIALIILLAGCDKPDHFIEVNKMIHMPDVIVVNKPFNIRLVLRNDSMEEMRLTISSHVQNSILFMPTFECNGEYVRSEHYESEGKAGSYKTIYLKRGDSLVYDILACLKKKDRWLQLEIDGYSRIYTLAGTDCDKLTIDMYGMWYPGKPYFLDSQEGYGFSQEGIKIIENTKVILWQSRDK